MSAVVDEALCSSQQRDEIMQVLSYAVNSFFPTPLSYQQPQVLVFVNQFLGEANYNKGFAAAQGAHGQIVSYYLECVAGTKFRRS